MSPSRWRSAPGATRSSPPDPSDRVGSSPHAPHRPARADQALSGRGDRARRPDARPRARDHRARRRQRRRQEHAAQDPPRAARADRRHGGGHGHGRARPRDADPPVRRVHARVRLPARRHVGHRLRQPHGPDVRPARVRGPRADGRGAAARRPVRGALPRDRGLLHGDEAAGQARPGPRPRPEAAPARRADERPRPGGPRRDAGPGPADRHRVRDRRDRRQPPARRDRAGLRLPRRDRCRPAAPRRAARQLHGADGLPRGGGRGGRDGARRRARRARAPAGRRRADRRRPDRRRPSIRHRPRRARRARPAAGPARAAPTRARGPVRRRAPNAPSPRPRRGVGPGRPAPTGTSRDERIEAAARATTAATASSPAGASTTSATSGTTVRAWAGRGVDRAAPEHLPVRVRDRPRRAGQDRPVHARGARDPAGDPRGRDRRDRPAGRRRRGPRAGLPGALRDVPRTDGRRS